MDLTALAGLLPLGGASVLLIYMLQIWLTERRSWSRERKMLYEMWIRERQDLIEGHRREVADREHDYQAHVKVLRERLRDLMMDTGRSAYQHPDSAAQQYHEQSDSGEAEGDNGWIP
jgi:hypothetical protein